MKLNSYSKKEKIWLFSAARFVLFFFSYLDMQMSRPNYLYAARVGTPIFVVSEKVQLFLRKNYITKSIAFHEKYFVPQKLETQNN